MLWFGSLNYLFAYVSFSRIHDAGLLQIDPAIYVWLFGLSKEPVGMFPLVHCQALLQLLENAYVVVFVEIFVVLFIMHNNWQNVRLFFRPIFLRYVLALIVFFIVPAVGPCIYFPETFNSAYHGTLTYKLMHGMYSEYEALKLGESLSGFGYFVAVPSLHVAIAILLQRFLYLFRIHFGVFLPVNSLIILSAFILDYHYLIDILAGILLTFVVLLSLGLQADRSILISS